jgi:hypothetical protein
MKFPSASTGAFVPSGSSLAETNPGVCGSRVGGTAWAGDAVAANGDGLGESASAGMSTSAKLNNMTGKME